MNYANIQSWKRVSNIINKINTNTYLNQSFSLFLTNPISFAGIKAATLTAYVI